MVFSYRQKASLSPLDVFFVFLAVLSVALFVLMMWESGAHASAAHPVQRWEYRCMNRTHDVSKHANILGAQGWEMVGAAALPAAQNSALGLIRLDESIAERTARFASQETALESFQKVLEPLMVWCFKRAK